MANLIVPNPQQHKYIVGIDFGHGETSAAICEIDWGSQIGLSNVSVTDVRINPANTGNEKVIVSAISQITDEKPQIGENAFGAEQLQDNASIRVCFKEPPHSINGEAETLMTKFMKAVYEQIRSISSQLTDDNHIVYIARPSGWQNEQTKELYMQMALRAGLPLGGLTSESRAAIFYALNDPKIAFKNEIAEGAIVFDLGSSTLDFTYIAGDHKPIDYGYPHGASLVDKVIFDDKMASCDCVKRLLASHPQYKDALLFQARKLKEDFYKKTLKTAAIDIAVPLRNIISRECSDYNNLKNEQVIIEYENIDAFNETLETQIGYKTKIREDLADFKNNHIAGKEIKGVFMTGGASRMGFISEIIREEYGLSPDAVKMDPDNPSLTISRGIAMLGRADVLSSVLQKELMAKAEAIDVNIILPKYKEAVVTSLTDLFCTQICNAILKFKKSDEDLNLMQLNELIDEHLFQCNVASVQNEIFKNCVLDNIKDFCKELNDIVALYQPKYKMKESAIVKTEESTDVSSLQIANMMDSVVEEIREEFSFISDYGVLLVLFPAAALLIYILKIFRDIFMSKEEKERRYNEELQKPIKKKDRIDLCSAFVGSMNDIRKKIRKSLNESINRQESKNINESFRQMVVSVIKNYVNENIENVKIDIE